jgi:flagellar basal-body rod protein FlgG
MLQGLYAAAAGMEAQQTQLDALSNDIANVNTAGYQGERVGFHDLLYQSGGYNGLDTVATGTGSAAAMIGRSQAQGPIQPTSNPLDLAINGDGYFEAKLPDGTIGLTRNGTMQLNASGQLTTNLGMVLQPPITVPPGVKAEQLRIQPDGTVIVGSKPIGKITLGSPPAPDQMLAAGNGMYTTTAASGALRPATGTIQQGALEQSNVDVNQAMSHMVQTEQSYDMASKAISFEQQMAQIAVQVKS